jgi:YHS domain-containing protein
MTVAVTAASLSTQLGGVTWYFCGSGHRDAFRADLSRYSRFTVS